MNDTKENRFQLVDEHWQMFEDISQNESYKNLKAHANEMGKTMKEAFTNVLEIQKVINDDK
ncbi:hypothetical protein [Fluoribacter dumoffii]|uniref:Uncharacterized protein n=1 Tax=Fluoribacter dumoffii TaxID=463 RepID=A0A377ITQ5_9GAMM|nr:hypothetical protein [Fluoribacter dumoffii]KTC89158.1 hypothetical protein Ldum_2834 [Fluoribacter dumoffii NY 23]STO91570.1 Uncharacterised protein [Fluoribacter dumoffii]